MNKKILLLVPRLNIGGAETYVAELAISLKQDGYEVFVASGGGVLVKKIKQVGIKHFFVPFRLSVEIAKFLVLFIVKKYKIDLIHANSAATGITAVKVKDSYNIPVIYTAHGVFGHNKKEMTLNLCDEIICVSNFVKNDAISKGFDSDKLRVIYNGIDTEKFIKSETKREYLRKKYNIPKDAFVMTITSRIKNANDKGHNALLEILKKYELPNTYLIVIGKGKGLSKLKKVVKEYKLEKKVLFLGHILAVQEILDITDITVLPSKFETFGLVIAEGMAMNKPAIAYNVGGVREVIDDNLNGFLVSNNDIDNFYQKISFYIKNKEKLEIMGEEARRKVLNCFSLQDMLLKIKEVYRSLTQGEMINKYEENI